MELPGNVSQGLCLDFDLVFVLPVLLRVLSKLTPFPDGGKTRVFDDKRP